MKTAKYRIKPGFTKKKIETLLNETFVLDERDKNEETIRQYAQNIGVTVT